MIADLYELCTSGGLIAVFAWSDLIIGISYFSIPVSMLIVLRRRREDLPYTWLWILFVAFIAACGTTHTLHVFSLLDPGESWLEGGVRAVTAAVSAVTAIALAVAMPAIKTFPSPAGIQRMLRGEVAAAIAGRDAAIREMHHRVGNMAQIVESAERLIEAAGEDRDRVARVRQIAAERMRALVAEHQAISEAA
jgi:hypothetical protein